MFLLLACSDYKLEPEGEDPVPFDTGGTLPTDTEADTAPPPPTEECDGKDNDGDGAVDEDFSDIDGDGTADCQDDDCVTESPAARSDVREDCQGSVDASTPPADPWRVRIEWQYSTSGVVSTPSVGDLDADGIPEVVWSDDGSGGQLVVARGDTGAILWRHVPSDLYSGSALADTDGDGFGEVFATTGSCFSAHTVYALDHTGAELWEVPIGTACETYPAVADLEGDGSVEVVVNEYVLDAATGALEATLDIDGANNWGAVAIADMDQDGDQEILLENRVYEHDGTLKLSCGSGGTGTFPQPVNVDGDDEGEILVASPGQVTLCDDTGAVLWNRSHRSTYGSAIAVADFDNDGVQEYAFAASGELRLMEPDGTDRWVTPINDSSGLAGTTSWDIDLDGVPEVVYADEQDIMAIDGRTGSIVIRDPNHGSWTAAETPAVADVDGDGAGELVYGSNSGYTGVTVIGGADGDWPYSRPVYNQYSYYSANIDDGLQVPSYQDAPWMADANLFRGQPSAIYTAGVPNGGVAITDLCVSSCEAEGVIDLWLQVWSDGGRSLDGDTTVRLYGYPDGARRLVHETTLGTDLAAGTSLEIPVQLTRELVGGFLEAVLDEDDAEGECDETDNDDDWADFPCP